jgi:hypothetical protein
LLAILALACSNTPVIAAEPTANKPAAPDHIPDVGNMIVCVDALNVRVAPGTGNETVSEPLIRGTIVTVTGTPEVSEDGGMWIKVAAPLAGWVNAKHLCKNGD